jgi:hypothetical protein
MMVGIVRGREALVRLTIRGWRGRQDEIETGKSRRSPLPCEEPTMAASDLAQQALRAFQRDLPDLWAERPEQWVAYRGDQQLGFPSTSMNSTRRACSGACAGTSLWSSASRPRRQS